LSEEIMKRPRVDLPDPFDPFGGFSYERRSKTMTTIARKQGSVAGKLFNCFHSCTLEAGAEHLRVARDLVKGYVRDQGSAERGTAKAPWGDPEEIRTKLAGIKAGDLSFIEVSKETAFWPNVFEHSDMCHILQNAIEESLKAEEDWKTYEPLLKAACKIIGDTSYKERLLHECFKDAPASARHGIHQFSAEHVDWRWEYLEKAEEQLTNIWEEFAERFDAAAFTEEAALVRKVKDAIILAWFGPFSEFLRVFTHAVGSEMRWCEGCFCHEHILWQRQPLLSVVGRCLQVRTCYVLSIN